MVVAPAGQPASGFGHPGSVLRGALPLFLFSTYYAGLADHVEHGVVFRWPFSSVPRPWSWGAGRPGLGMADHPGWSGRRGRRHRPLPHDLCAGVGPARWPPLWAGLEQCAVSGLPVERDTGQHLLETPTGRPHGPSQPGRGGVQLCGYAGAGGYGDRRRRRPRVGRGPAAGPAGPHGPVDLGPVLRLDRAGRSCPPRRQPAHCGRSSGTCQGPRPSELSPGWRWPTTW